MIRFKMAEVMGTRKVLNISELARKAGLSRLTIRGLYYEKAKGIRWDTLEKICRALNCSVSDLIEYIPDEQS